MKINAEKLIRKSLLSMAYSEISDEPLRDRVLAEYAKLLEENDLSNRMLMRHQTESIYPSIAMRRALDEGGYVKAQSFALMRNSVLNSAEPMVKMFQRMGRLPFRFALLRVLCPASMKSAFGEAGWDMRWKANNRNEIRCDCHACYYQKEFARYGMPELTAIFCEFDDVVYGNIPGVKWGRTKTIGRGAELCDFCFIKGQRR
jgi:hypothetical protein